MKYCRIIDWRKLQHYKDRAPVWIKMYTGDRTDVESPWLALTDAQRGQLATLRMLAADLGNCIPYDADYIAEEIQATDPVDLDALGVFLEVHPNKRACMEAEQLVTTGDSTREPKPHKSASTSASNLASNDDSKAASRDASKSASDIAMTEEEEEVEEEKRKIKKRRKGGTTVGASTRKASRPPTGIPPGSPDSSKPSPETELMLAQIAGERGLDIAGAAAAAGVAWPISGTPLEVGRQVTALKAWMKQEPALTREKVERLKHRMDLDARWETLEPNLYDPSAVATELIGLNEADKRAARGLLTRFEQWVAQQTGRRIAEFTSMLPGGRWQTIWDVIHELDVFYDEVGLTASHGDSRGEVANG